MIQGLGIDTVEVNRFATWIDDPRKISRFFHATEVAYIQRIPPHRRAASLAARFAAKEAFGKATGHGLRGVRLVDIAVTHHPVSSAPQLVTFNTAKKMVDNIAMYRIHLSLTHTDTYATALVIIDSDE